MRKTRAVMARTSLVFRRMAVAPYECTKGLGSIVRSYSADDRGNPSGNGRLAHGSVSLQLIMQRLEAYAQNLGGARLVLAGGFKGANYQHPFRLIHGDAHLYRHHARVVALHCRCLHLAESWWQVPSIEGRAVGAQDDCPLNR